MALVGIRSMSLGVGLGLSKAQARPTGVSLILLPSDPDVEFSATASALCRRAPGEDNTRTQILLWLIFIVTLTVFIVTMEIPLMARLCGILE